MQIIWKGQSCFQIIAKQEKNSQISIVIDPFDGSCGLRVPSLEAEILLVTHHHRDHDNTKAVKGTPFLIDGPGEYEIKGAFIQGIPSFHDDAQGKERGVNTIYTVEAEEIKLCHLGDFGQKELTGEQLEKIGSVDILMIPVGGTYTIDSKIASNIISQIEPKIVIPMHYKIPKLEVHPHTKRGQGAKGAKIDEVSPRYGVGVKLEGVDKFLKTMGLKSVEPLNKLLIKKKDLSLDETKIIVLKP